MAALPGGFRVHAHHGCPLTTPLLGDSGCTASSSGALADPEATLHGVAHAPLAVGLAAALVAALVGRRGSWHCRASVPLGTTRVRTTRPRVEVLRKAEEAQEIDRRDWSKTIPKHEELEKWEDGEKWILCKDGKLSKWRRETELGTYRYTDGGYESRDASGKWVNYAQMPQDVTHLTDAQRERLVKELRGEIKVSMSDGDLDDFKPMAQVPPLEKWPFHEVAITEELQATKEQLDGYKELEMSSELGRAFFLSARWKGANEARRHLGYNVNDELQDVANMNGTVLALRCLTEQLKRAARFRKQDADQPEPSDANRLRALCVTGLLGTTKGSALALWYFLAPKKRIVVDLCIGDDCMDQGPYAEAILLRFLACKGAELGAETLWCRTRRTESGMIFVPKYMPKLGFKAVPYELQEEEEWEVAIKEVVKKEIVESVTDLKLWMSTRGLEHHVEAANAWCEEMGAADINEVADSKRELADYLAENAGLTEEERDRLLQY